MKKRFLAGALSAALALSMLTGCSQDSATETTTAVVETAVETDAETTATETSQETTPAESAATVTTDGPLKVVATSEDYVQLFDKFTEETGIETELLSMSSGEVLSKIKAEGGTSMADVWFGGGIDAFMGAKED